MLSIVRENYQFILHYLAINNVYMSILSMIGLKVEVTMTNSATSLLYIGLPFFRTV